MQSFGLEDHWFEDRSWSEESTSVAMLFRSHPKFHCEIRCSKCGIEISHALQRDGSYSKCPKEYLGRTKITGEEL